MRTVVVPEPVVPIDPVTRQAGPVLSMRECVAGLLSHPAWMQSRDWWKAADRIEAALVGACAGDQVALEDEDWRKLAAVAERPAAQACQACGQPQVTFTPIWRRGHCFFDAILDAREGAPRDHAAELEAKLGAILRNADENVARGAGR